MPTGVDQEKSAIKRDLKVVQTLQPILDFVVEHAECHHRLAQLMRSRNDDGFDAGEQIEAIQGTSDSIRQYLSGQVRHIDAVS